MKIAIMLLVFTKISLAHAAIEECVIGMKEAQRFLKEQHSIKINEKDWMNVTKECEANGELYSKQFKSMSSIMKNMNSKQISCKLGSGFIAHDRFLKKYSTSTHILGMAIGENGQRYCMSKF